MAVCFRRLKALLKNERRGALDSLTLRIGNPLACDPRDAAGWLHRNEIQRPDFNSTGVPLPRPDAAAEGSIR